MKKRYKKKNNNSFYRSQVFNQRFTLILISLISLIIIVIGIAFVCFVINSDMPTWLKYLLLR